MSDKKIYDSFVEAFTDGMSTMKWWEHIYYPLYRSYKNFTYMCKKIKQRWTTGFAHEESWNLNSFHAAWIIPRLKHLRDNNMGCYPIGLTEDRWVETLNEMIWSFENFDKTIGPDYPDGYDHRFERIETKHGTVFQGMENKLKPSFERNRIHHKKVSKGLHLFAKYYTNLWD